MKFKFLISYLINVSWVFRPWLCHYISFWQRLILNESKTVFPSNNVDEIFPYLDIYLSPKPPHFHLVIYGNSVYLVNFNCFFERFASSFFYLCYLTFSVLSLRDWQIRLCHLQLFFIIFIFFGMKEIRQN